MSDFRVDSRIQREARALAQRGDEVDLICVGERDEIRVGDGVIRIHPVSAEKATGGPIGYLRDYGRFLLGALVRVSLLDGQRPFDLVEAHNMPDVLTAAAIVPRLRGAPVILNVHDTFPELFATRFGRRPQSGLVRAVELEERLGAAMAQRVVTVTDEARVRLESRGVAVGRTAVVMNSPDERVFGPPRSPVAPPRSGPIRLLYHGGLAPRFGVETLIRAVGVLHATGRALELRICGSGTDRDRLAGLAAAVAPGRIDVAPAPVPFTDIPAELEAAHIGVVPTEHDRFTELLLPVKLLEYVHMGLPVVASRLPGIERYFPAQELALFTPGDPVSLARAVESVCDNPSEAHERALRANDRLAEFAWPSQRAGYLRLVDDLVGSSRRASER